MYKMRRLDSAFAEEVLYLWYATVYIIVPGINNFLYLIQSDTQALSIFMKTMSFQLILIGLSVEADKNKQPVFPCSKGF